MMVLRTAMLGAMVLCTASLAMADEVLYCTDTHATGFRWDQAGNANSARFNEERYTMKVISDTERVISDMSGSTAGRSHSFTCHASALTQDQIICDDEDGGYRWVFYRNNYTHAFLQGPPVGPPNSMDQNIWVAYGTCTRF
jgi:hypothetical protein